MASTVAAAAVRDNVVDTTIIMAAVTIAAGKAKVAAGNRKVTADKDRDRGKDKLTPAK